MSGVFDIIKKINTKQELSQDELDNFDKVYNRFLVNRYFSMFEDTVMVIQEMNKRDVQHSDMSNYEHYIYLNTLVPKKNRYEKWKKFTSSEVVDLLKLVYKYSTKRAIEVAGILSEDDLIILRKKAERGGVIE